MPRPRHTLGLALAALAGWGTAVPAAPSPARNVILMVADGGGFNTFKATAMYEGRLGKEFHDEEGWVRLAASTYALRPQQSIPVSEKHGLTQLPALVYDPVRAWDPAPEPPSDSAFPYFFAGYRWLRETAPDSANTMSALVTGQRTYNGSINYDGNLRPIENTLAHIAHASGRRVGVISSVMFAHATPAAAAGAHQSQRSNYCHIAVEMLTGAYPDVIAGCGNPDFDNNGEPLEAGAQRDYAYVGGKPVWEALSGVRALEAGTVLCAATATAEARAFAVTPGQVSALSRWKLVQSRSEIEALREGSTPERLLVVPQVGEIALWNGQPGDTIEHPLHIGGTLQQSRGSRVDPRFTAPGYDAPNAGVPSLETLTRVALNALDDDENGFFLHVEGGAVDWAMHANQLGRMIEETIDFERSVAAVVEWVASHGGWSETLVIVTADHDHMLWGPAADTIPFDPLKDNGAGHLPSYRWLSASHSNALVPVWARGAGADRLVPLATGSDPFYGPYLGQTDLYDVMRSVLIPVQ